MSNCTLREPAALSTISNLLRSHTQSAAAGFRLELSFSEEAHQHRGRHMPLKPILSIGPTLQRTMCKLDINIIAAL